MNRIFAMLGLKLSVARAIRDTTPVAIQAHTRSSDDEGRDT